MPVPPTLSSLLVLTPSFSCYEEEATNNYKTVLSACKSKLFHVEGSVENGGRGLVNPEVKDQQCVFLPIKQHQD